MTPANYDLLRLNVGFIIHEGVGYFRDFPIEIPQIRLEDDFRLQDLNGVVRVTRTAQGLLVQVKLSALTDADCGRCLTNMMQPLHVDFTELYAFTQDQITESGLLVPETGKIDLGLLVRDEMLLAVPINSVCRPDCAGLCLVCGEDLNINPHTHAPEETDPRLDALKTLLERDDEPSSD